MKRARAIAMLALALLLAQPALTTPISNTATGSSGGAALDGTQATINLNRLDAEISGRVFEDADFAGTATDWDNGVSDLGLPDVDVELYDASDDSFVDSVATIAGGVFTFATVPDGTYKVRVRSATIGDADTLPAGGLNATVPATWPYPLPEMTWANGAALYGGQDPAVDDTTTGDDAGPGDTWASVTVSGADVTDVNLGFAYNLIVNTADDANVDNVRSAQGGLRQFIKNANAIGTAGATTANSSRFRIPGASPHTIQPVQAIPAIDDPVILDGRTQPGFVAAPNVVLDGVSAGGTVDGLVFANGSDGSTLAGLTILRFTRDGVLIQTGADNLTIVNNWIGTDGSGLATMGNGDEGIDVFGAGTTIGGTGANDGNVITNNDDEGINLAGAGATGNVILGNIIGLDPDGTSGSGNGDVGIAILAGSTGNTIGGTALNAENVISMNLEGIEINTSNNTVVGNYIGTDSAGTLDRGARGDDGVEIQAGTGNTIGGIVAGAGNVIAFSQRHGVTVKGGSDNSVLGNRIHSNDLLGIDLANDGVTENDGNDGDPGPNELLNFPEITSATEFAGSVSVNFDLDVPAGWHRIEFFTNTAADPSGNGEGETFVDSIDVDHPGGGSQSFAHSFAGSVGDILTATTTECTDGPTCSAFASTSEFSDAVTVDGGADLSITKDDGSATYTPGGSLTYTIVVSNAGPSDAVDASVSDTFDVTRLTNINWGCVATGTADCGAVTAGAADISVSDVDIAAGAGNFLTYTVTADVLASATGNLVNTATVTANNETDLVPANNTATDTDTLASEADLSITKDDGSATYTPGGSLTYTIVVSNAGPSDAVDASVSDTFDVTRLTNINWGCVATGTANCGAATGGIGNIAVGDVDIAAGAGNFLTYTVTADVLASATGNLVNTATVTANNETDLVPANNTATDTDTPASEADLSITKDDGSATYTPGGSLTYTIVVSNAGPTDSVDASVADTFDVTRLTNINWGCVATGTADCGAVTAGAADISVSDVDIAAGAGNFLTYTVTADVLASATGNLVNTATVTANNETDLVPANNTATDTDTPASEADLSITKDDGSATYTPGGSLTYTIVVSNAGPTDSVDASVADTFDVTRLTNINWGCVATGTADCGATTGGTGNIAVGDVDIVAGAGNFLTYTVTADVLASATGNLVNTATVTANNETDLVPANNTATDTDTLASEADLSITKDDGSATYTPGGSLTYTIVVSNAGPSDAVDASVSDTFDVTRLTNINWGCVATGTANCGAVTAGAADISVSDVDIAAGAGNFLTYTVTADVLASATGNLVNTATVTANNETDLVPANNTATDTDTLASEADLSITKDDGSATYTPGGSLTYTIVVSNAGPSDTVDASVADTFDVTRLTNINWGCVATGTANCGAVTGGTGNIAVGDVDIAAGAGNFLTYTVTADVLASATGNLVNTATVTANNETDLVPANNTATDTDTPASEADLSITKDDGSATYTPGGSLTYTIVVSNAGPTDSVDASVADTFDVTRLTNINWGCVATGTANCGAATGGIGNIAVGDVDIAAGAGNFLTYTVTADVLASATGNLVNTATVTANNETDLVPANNTATDTDTPASEADLSITKDDGSATYTPGGSLTYTIVVSNAGPTDSVDASVADTFDVTRLTNINWGCVATGTANCGAATGGIGNIAVGDVDIAAGAGNFLTYTVTADVLASATGNLVNTATVTANNETDLVPANNTATDTDTPASEADLSITKDDGSATYTPGGSLTYTIVVSNAGPTDSVDASVADTFDVTRLTNINWGCVATGTADCGAVTAGAADISVSDVDIAAGAGNFLTYTVTADVLASATGNLVNTATVTANNETDLVPANNTATDTDTPASEADLSITKDDGSATYTPGGSLTYTIVVSNAGPTDSVDASVADTFDVTRLTNINWGCVATGTADCGATTGGTGNIAVGDVDIVAGAGNFLTYTVTADVLASATGNLVNTATVTANNETDLVPANNTATDTDTLASEADLSITKDDGSATYTPGGSLTYTIVVSNAGPSDAVDASVSDTFDVTRLTNINWGCVATGTANCGAVTAGAADISVSDVDIAAGAGNFLTYTVTADVLASATGNLVNTATVTANNETDLVPANNTATDTDTLASEADLSITKDDGSATYTPGGSLTYTIVVSNAGPSDAVDASVADTFDVTRLTNINWGCVVTGTADCGAVTGGTGNIAVADVDIAAGPANFLTYTVTADVLVSATGNLVNTATVTANNETDLVPANNTATDTDTLASESDLSITKDDGSLTYTPGGSLTYTIVVSNAGPSDAVDASVSDTFDLTRLTNINWGCVVTGTADCGAVTGGAADINVSDVDIAAGVGNFLTYTVTADVLVSATGNLVNTATVTANNETDLVPANNTATDTDTLASEADLSITKDDGSVTYTPGGSLTYTIVVSNAGPSDAVDASVADTFDLTRLTNINWGCVVTGTADCGAVTGGTGNIAVADVDIAAGVGNFLTYTVTADVLVSATGNLVNTATVTANNETDLVPANNTATDTDTLASESDLSITKDDGSLTYTPGGSLTYTIVVSNAGPSDAVDASVSDTFDVTRLTNINWGCVATGTADCGAVTGGAADISVSDVDIAAGVGNFLTYTVTADVLVSATGNLVNTATVTANNETDLVPANNTATDTDTLASEADLSITKDDGSVTYTPGGSLTYTIVVSNAGPSDAVDASVADTFDVTRLTNINWGCVVTGTADCGAVTGGAADISVSDVDIAAGAGNFLTYTVTADVLASATGNLVNTATVTANNETDLVPANNSATDTDTLASEADLSITKDDGSATYTPGGTVTYTIVVSNAGPSDAVDASVADTFDVTRLTNINWSCVATGSADCGITASGTGDIAVSDVDIPAGAGNFLTYTITTDVLPGAIGILANTATVTANNETDLVPANNSATDTDALDADSDLSVTKDDGQLTYTPGGTVTYTIVVSNAGPSDAPGALVTDSISGLPQVASASWTCVASAGASCTAGPVAGDINDTIDVPVGGVATYTLVATLDSAATGDLVNTANVTPPAGKSDTNAANDSATDVDTESASADLSLTKVVDNSAPDVGTDVTFTLTVSNAGPSDASGILVTDLLPAGYTYVSDNGGGAYNSGSGVWTAGTVTAGGFAALQITATVESAGPYTNAAEITAAVEADPDSTPNNGVTTEDDYAEVPTTPNGVADLSLTKIVDNATPGVGTSVTFTLTVSNAGPSDATGVELTDLLPAGYTYVSDNGGGSYVSGTGLWTVGAVSAGGSMALQIDATVEAAGPYLNAAEVTAVNEPDPDSTPDNGNTTEDDYAEVSTTPQTLADLSLAQVVDNPTPDVGTPVTFTLTVSNAGPNDASGVEVLDLLPSGYSYMSDDGGGAYNSGTGMWNIGTVPSGGSLVLNITASVQLSGLYTNPAEVFRSNEADPDSVPGNGVGMGEDDEASVSTSPNGLPSLVLNKTANKGGVTMGDVVTYTIEIGNNSGGAMSGITIQDTIPPNFKYVRGTATLDGVAIAEPVGPRPLVFDIGTVADGAELRLVYQLAVGAGATPGNYVNSAVAVDSVVVSNTASASVDVLLDETFDLGLIIGKVFHDIDGNGEQDRGESGIPGVMIALDDGTHAITDEHGRYHLPAIKPGQRMLKLNRHTLPPGARAIGSPSRVKWITPGLMVPVDFGVSVQDQTRTIGAPTEHGLSVETEQRALPIDVQGNAETLTVFVNDRRVLMQTSDVRIAMANLDETVQLEGRGLEQPITFQVDPGHFDAVENWSFDIRTQGGELARRFTGKGKPPLSIVWDGILDDSRQIAGGEIYQYQLELQGGDGVVHKSARRVVGVNRREIIAVELMGEAFETGKAVLSPSAREVLDDAAEILRLHPEEKVVIEGHTDSVGSRESNLALSKKRAQAAADYLVEVDVARDRLILRHHGEDRPVASNAFEDGRALNRRVEVRGEYREEENAVLLDTYRRTPQVRINGESIDVGDVGQFKQRLETSELSSLTIEAADSQGRSAGALVALPTVEILAPRGSFVVPFSGAASGCRAGSELDGSVSCRVEGSTEPGNSVEFGDQALEVSADGRFDVEVDMAPGRNSLDFLARTPEGYARVVNVEIDRSDTDEDGRRIVVREGIPNLSVNLPPHGSQLSGSTLNISGTTDPGNRIALNGQPLEVATDGRFSGALELEPGRHRIEVAVVDAEDRQGRVETEVEVPKHQLFLLAFADGKIGALRSSGYIEGAGQDEKDELFAEGRLAFYLKGKIAGKYLITSAYDSGKEDAEYLFQDVDTGSNDRLLRNLDPDKFYPIYGDGSQAVYDAESQGRFYLAVDSEEIHALVGDFAMALTDTELASYQRTLYGGRFVYHAASSLIEGQPDTEVVAFVAEVQQAHVHDELRATGGSLYYLSHPDVVEGSEQVTLVVRDTTTGLTLSREIQRQNVDYTVKYEEGRLMFHRPLSSVTAGGSLVNPEILSGHPTYIQVDYETRLDDFEKTGYGVRARRQLGKHLSLGATHIEDEREGGEYDLTGVDARINFGKNSRLLLEHADSSGADSLVFVSDDGGITYNEIAVGGNREGTAWKVAAELDVGEWFNRPDRYRAGIYHKELESDFFSSGNFLEQGTRKTGANVSLQVTEKDAVRVRHDEEERLGTLPVGATKDIETQSVQWEHKDERWGVATEYRSNEQQDASGTPTGESDLGAARIWAKPTEKLTTRVDHQETLSGDSNDQTTVAVEYQALPSLGLQLQGTDGSNGQSAQGGAILSLGESQIYLTQRLSDETVGRRDSTVLGARSPLGPSSKVYTEYQWDDTAGGQQFSSVLGLQRNWDLASGFRFVLSGETSDVDSPSMSTSRSAVNTGLFYQSEKRLAAKMQNTLRFEDAAERREQFVTFSQLDYKLNSDFTLLAKYRYSKTRDRDTDLTEAKLDERSVGLAYRPVAHNRLNTLFRYTDLYDERPASNGFVQSNDREVLSLDLAYRLHRRLESLSKAALRTQQETQTGTPETSIRTRLMIERLNVGLWKSMDLGLEYRVLDQPSTDDQRQGWLTELSWRLHEHFRTGVGYNFTDFSDDEFSSNDYSVHGWFLRVQGMY